MALREGDKDFEVDSSDKNDAQVFNLDFTYQITKFTDYTKTAEETLEENFTTVINVINPCESTTLRPLTIADMIGYVDLGPRSQEVVMPTDTVSETYGNQDGYTACGKRAIEIVDIDTYSGFLTLDPDTGTITIDADPDDFGIYEIEVQIYLEEYPT